MVAANASMLLVGVSPEAEHRLASALRGFAVERCAADLDAVGQAVARLKPATALVAVHANGNGEASLRLVSHLARDGAKVIVLGASKDADLILRSMRAGAQEFVVAGQEQELAAALLGCARPAVAQPGSSVIAVFPAKGGLGATAVAVNLAGALARRGERACLLDLDSRFGDVLSVLDLPGAYSAADVVANMHRLDRELLDASVAHHKSGLFVLGQQERIDQRERLDPKDVAALIGFLRNHYRFLVLDGAHGFDEVSLAALDACDTVALLVTQEVPAVRNAQRARVLFHQLGYADAKVRLLVNRFQRTSKITLALVAETVGLPVAATLSNDFAALMDAVQRGVLLCDSAPRSPLARDLDRLAEEFDGVEVQVEERRPLWARLFQRGETA